MVIDHPLEIEHNAVAVVLALVDSYYLTVVAFLY